MSYVDNNSKFSIITIFSDSLSVYMGFVLNESADEAAREAAVEIPQQTPLPVTDIKDYIRQQ